MPEAKNSFQKAVDQLIDVIMFENWLRFYFIRENAETDPEQDGEEPELYLELPEKAMNKIRELYPELYPLAERLNDKKIDFETSRQGVMTFIMENVDGKMMPRGEVQSVFSSRIFQQELELFHAWTQLHEEQLDQTFFDFGAWRTLFHEWRKNIQQQNKAQIADDQVTAKGKE